MLDENQSLGNQSFMHSMKSCLFSHSVTSPRNTTFLPRLIRNLKTIYGFLIITGDSATPYCHVELQISVTGGGWKMKFQTLVHTSGSRYKKL